MARYSGRRGVVYMSTSGTGDATNVISLTQWSLGMATDKQEVTAFGDANKTYVQGLPDISGRIAGFFDDAEDKLYQASQSSDGVKIYLYPSANASTVYWYGPAWVDFGIETGVSGPVSVNSSIAANGNWGKKP